MIVVNAGGLNLTVADPEHLIEEVLGLPVPPTGDLLLELPYVGGPTVLRSALDSAPARKPYYLGSDVRIAGAVASYPHAERVGDAGGRLLVTNLTPEQ